MGLKRPWNIVDVPIYSLATYSDTGINMNICTYVTAVSMKPKLFMLAIDYTTQTFQNLKSNDTCVLQILHTDAIDLVRTLGKKSGKNTDKEAFLRKKNQITSWNKYDVLKDACGYLALRKIDQKNIGGDHELFWFEVEKSKTISENNILMFQDLIEAGHIL